MTDRARLDTNGTAEPKTKLVGHVRAGDCVGPGTASADAIEDVATGERTALSDPTSPYGIPGTGKTVDMGAKKLWLHLTVQDGVEIKAFASLKSGSEVRDYFSNYVGELPYRFPESFSTIWVKYVSEDGSRGEVFQWGTEDCLIDGDQAAPDDEGVHGYLVEVDGVAVYNTMDPGDGEEHDEEHDEENA